MPGLVFLVVLVILLVLIVVKNVVIVPQASAYVVERLGMYHATWETGLHLKIPFMERIARKVSLKEQVIDFAPQSVITKDNVTMQIDSVVYLFIVDPKSATYGVENPIAAIENMTATSLRNIIGEMELDQTLTSRDNINAKMRQVLDEATDPWGIKITRVELKNIMPPRDIQESMEKQMRAERERREAILQAEGQKQSQILVAEGEKQSAILRAQAQKESAILTAQAQKEAAILAAEADQEARVKRALGEAESIRLVQEARAEGLSKIKGVAADDGLIRLQSLEALSKMANGTATKIIIPSNLQGLAGTLTGLVETVKEDT